MLGRPTVWLSRSQRERLAWLGFAYSPDENGGILLGYWRADGRDVVITEIVAPGPRARRSPVSFEPDADYDADAVARAYTQSRGTVVYLGDWHSHPHGDTTLSKLDRRTLRLVAGDEAARVHHPLMCIVAGREGEKIAVWLGRANSRAILLPVRHFED